MWGWGLPLGAPLCHRRSLRPPWTQGPGKGGRRQQVGIEPKGRSLTASLSVLSLPASDLPRDRQDARQPRSRNPSSWSVEDVVWFLKDADPQALGPHVELFRKHVCRVGVLGGFPELWGGERLHYTLRVPLEGGQRGPQVSQSRTAT